jgi:Ca2+-transporting ATPase
MVFTLLAISPLMHAWSCRSPEASIFTVGLFGNRLLVGAAVASAAVHLVTFLPPLRPIFHTVPLDLPQWAVVLGLSALPVPALEIGKVVLRASRARRSAQAAS